MLTPDEFGDINTAAALGCVDSVRAFLRENPACAHERDKNADGATPLFHAAWGGNIELAEVLLQHGANINEKDNSGETPIHGAAAWGRSKMVRWLITNGADVNIISNGYSPLHWAAQNGTGVVARILLEAGANPVAVDHLGVPPLERAKNNPPAARVIKEYLRRLKTQ